MQAISRMKLLARSNPSISKSIHTKAVPLIADILITVYESKDRQHGRYQQRFGRIEILRSIRRVLHSKPRKRMATLCSLLEGEGVDMNDFHLRSS